MAAQTSISRLIVDPQHPTTQWPVRAQSIGAQVVEWIKTCVHYYRAAAAYETLRRLSDTELERRELCRATLRPQPLRALAAARPSAGLPNTQ